MPLYYKDNDNTWKEFATNPYPIGTLVSLTKDNSPATLVGGTWTKVVISNTEELIGYVAEATDPDYYGSVSNYSFFHDGSEVTGTFTWNQGRTSGSQQILLFSGLPTVSSTQTVGSVNGENSVSIDTGGNLYLNGNRFSGWNDTFPVSISYTSNQMLGGGIFRLRTNCLTSFLVVV